MKHGMTKYRNSNTAQLLPNLLEEWNKVLHGYIIRSIQFMQHRYAIVVDLEGMATKY